MDVLIPKKTKSGEPEIKKIVEKLKYSNELILHNEIINVRGNQITYMIQEFEIPFLG